MKEDGDNSFTLFEQAEMTKKLFFTIIILMLIISCTREWGNPLIHDDDEKDTIPTYGLVAYYPFTRNANDESGNGNNGIVTGATLTSDRFRNEGCAYSFDGTDDYIAINKPSIPVPFTVVAWIFKIGRKNTQALLGSDYYIKIEQYNNTHLVGFTRKQVGDYTFNYEIPLNTWTCVSWVFDNDAKLYIDGEYKDSDSHTISCPMKNISSGANMILGVVDDLRIYNRALSEEELKILYHEGGGNETNTNFSLDCHS